MEQNKLSTILNLSSQANMQGARKTRLSQLNYVVVLGLEYLNERGRQDGHNPVSVTIHKSGELEINGLDETVVNDDNIRVYSDKKTTYSQDDEMQG